MATLGNSTTPPNQSWFDVTGNKQFWNPQTYTMPTGGGTATGFHIYCWGYGGTNTIRVVIWDSGNNIVWQSGNKSVTTQVRWQFVAIPNIFLSAGNYYLGFWSSGHVQWDFENGGGGVHYIKNIGGPVNNTGNNDEYSGQGFGNLGVYVDYNAGGATGSGGIAVLGSGGSLSYHPLMTLDPDGTWHRRPVMTLDVDGKWHHRG